MARMRTEAEPLRGISVARATAHGDLTPDNLFLDELSPSRLTGIDMQHRASAPITRDMARLLVWLESRRRRPARETLNGIAATEYAALVATPGLIGADQLPILRFMIGVMARRSIWTPPSTVPPPTGAGAMSAGLGAQAGAMTSASAAS